MEARGAMIYSSRSSRTNTIRKRSLVKLKVSATFVFVFSFLLVPRLSTESRKEYIHADGKVVAVETGAAVCGPYTVFEAPVSGTFDSAGGSGNVIVQGGDVGGCSWTASKSASWITLTGGGPGDGTVTYTVASNNGPARSGTITAAGQTVTVNQSNGCTYSLSPTGSGTIVAGGANGSFTVNASNSACPWTASKSASWITLTGAASGTGTGMATYSVENNSATARSGSITAGGKTYTVLQAGLPCDQYCSGVAAPCIQAIMASCTAQCQAQMPSNCSSNPSMCAQLMQGCMAQCQSQAQASCSSAYNSCMASCQQ